MTMKEYCKDLIESALKEGGVLYDLYNNGDEFHITLPHYKGIPKSKNLLKGVLKPRTGWMRQVLIFERGKITTAEYSTDKEGNDLQLFENGSFRKRTLQEYEYATIVTFKGSMLKELNSEGSVT